MLFIILSFSILVMVEGFIYGFVANCLLGLDTALLLPRIACGFLQPWLVRQQLPVTYLIVVEYSVKIS